MIEYNKDIKISKMPRGYCYFCDKLHPLSDTSGVVLYHRHLMSMKIGRWINTNENVHHIDGNRSNNDLSNLELMTHSNHAKKHFSSYSKTCCVCGCLFLGWLGSKYCSIECKVKNNKSNSNDGFKKHRTLRLTLKNCAICNNLFLVRNSKHRCCSRACEFMAQRLPIYNKLFKFDIPENELREMVWQTPMTKIAEKYGVSGNAVKKRCKKFGINFPTKGYWTGKHYEM
jgi:hypothetical protein